MHEGLKPPFKQPGAAATAMACCELCGSPANQKKGCSFWVWSAEGKKCRSGYGPSCSKGSDGKVVCSPKGEQQQGQKGQQQQGQKGQQQKQQD